MKKITLVADVMVRCPLLKKDIPESLCYDINSVAFGLCIPELINNIVDKDNAEHVCSNCEFRAI